jgi:hypothetical protein
VTVQRTTVGVPSKQTQQHFLRGVFRGHRFEVATTVTLQPRADFIAEQPKLPSTGKLHVQASKDVHQQFGVGKAALAIVVDFSGSMNSPLKTAGKPQKGGPRRIDKALDALEEVLSKDFLKGTVISLWVYSQYEGDPKEEPIVKQLRAPQKWDSNSQLLPLMNKLRNLVPFNETPLVRAMWKAKADLAGFEGLKTILVLTDGVDNRFENDKDLKVNKGNRNIPNFLKEQFKDSGILLNIIGFQLELTKAEIPEKEKFEKAIRDLDGNFDDVRDKNKLAETFEKSMKRKLVFRVERDSDGVPPEGLEQGEKVTDSSKNPVWHPLDPGYYKIRVEASKTREQRIQILPGDRLRLNLKPTPKGFVYERDLFADYFRDRFGREGVRETKKSWLIAALQNQQQRPEDPLSLMVTLEKTTGRQFDETGTVRQVTPPLVFFKVKVPGEKAGATPRSLHFIRLADYAAPAWGLDVRPWSPKDRPVLEVLWSEDLPPADGVITQSEHFKGKEILQRQVAVKVNKVEAGTVILESLEELPADAKTKVPRVKVRLSYPANKPFMVHSPIAGHQEHHFYTEANKYTCVLWGMSLEQLKTMYLISMEGFQEVAREEGRYAVLELGLPDDFGRPPP